MMRHENAARNEVEDVSGEKYAEHETTFITPQGKLKNGSSNC